MSAVSDANLDIVRQILDRWSEGDFSVAEGELDPHVVLVLRPEFPDAGAYVGLEGMGRYTRGFLEPWTRITIEAVELIPAGDSVVARVLQRGVGESSGAPAEFRYFQVWTLRGGRVIRLEMVREREEALEAVGLTP